MADNRILAKKGNRTKSFTVAIWNLLPANKNGWSAINIPIETPSEVLNKNNEVKNDFTPPEVKIPLPPKVSIKADIKAEVKEETKPKAKGRKTKK